MLDWEYAGLGFGGARRRGERRGSRPSGMQWTESRVRPLPEFKSQPKHLAFWASHLLIFKMGRNRVG